MNTQMIDGVNNAYVPLVDSGTNTGNFAIESQTRTHYGKLI